MNSEKIFYSIATRSIFSFLSSAKQKLIYPELIVKEFRDKEIIEIDRKEYLIVVGEGTLGMQDRYFRANIGKLTSGRAVELGNFLSSEKTSDSVLVCEKYCLIFLIKRSVFLNYFGDQNLISYLKKITKYPELRKIKNDLSLLGYSQKEIISYIYHLQLSTEINDDSQLQKGFIVIHSGQILFKIKDGYEDKDLVRLKMGQSLVYRTQTEISVHCSKLFVWFLPRLVSSSPQLSTMSNQLESLFDTVQREVEIHEAVKKHSGEDVSLHVEDDEFTVEDFSLENIGRIKKYKPVSIKQHDQMDCGAACMSTIANYYGKKISVASYRSLVSVTREGASMFSLKQAANQTGFDAIAIFSGLKAFKKMIFPAIALMQYHYVVVYEINDKYVHMSDPGVGFRKMPIDDFKAEWSGNALCLKTNNEFSSIQESGKSWTKYLKLLQHEKIDLFTAFLASVLIFIFGLGQPLFMQFLFDNVLANQNKKLLVGLAVMMILFSLLENYIKYCRNYILSLLTGKIEMKFSSLFFKQVLKLPLGFFAVRNVGDITSRIEEMAQIREFITNKTISTFLNLVTLFLYFIILYLYSPILVVVTFVMIPSFLLFLKYFGTKIRLFYNQLFVSSAKMQSLMYEQLDAALTLKSLNLNMISMWRWQHKFEKTLQEKKKFETIIAIFTGVKSFFDEFFKVVLLGVAIYLYMKEELSLGQVVAINTISGSLIQPFISIISLWDEFKQVQVSFDKVDDIFTAAPENYNDSSKSVEFKDDTIKFENISFQYGSELSPMVLSGVNLEIKKGETVAFVGGSGSGKSTLAYMLAGLYVPREGKVKIGGVDISQVPLNRLRQKVRVVLQDNNLFTGSVVDNITFGSSTSSFIDVVKAAKDADAHDFISSLPHGYNTELGEKGNGRLSGGQKQRINIARAFYSDPEILIMDEATSSLDAVAEEKIIDAVKKRQGRTTIIIAHRLNTISYADKIVVIDKGQVIEVGSHRELIKLRGRYYSLFKKQLNS